MPVKIVSRGEITFNEIERNADQTFAYALLVKLASSSISCAYRLNEVSGALVRLLSLLLPEKLDTLTPEQTLWLRSRLQEVHRLLAAFSRSDEAETISRIPFIGGLVAKVQDRTEDLDDVIEDLVLADNEEFKGLISVCASRIGLSVGDPIAGMHS